MYLSFSNLAIWPTYSTTKATYLLIEMKQICNLRVILIFFNSCRVEEFASIVPRQPYRPGDRPQEVRLEFEAILLDVSRDVRKNQLWIHAKIKACVAPNDCDQVRPALRNSNSFLFKKLLYSSKICRGILSNCTHKSIIS